MRQGLGNVQLNPYPRGLMQKELHDSELNLCPIAITGTQVWHHPPWSQLLTLHDINQNIFQLGSLLRQLTWVVWARKNCAPWKAQNVAMWRREFSGSRIYSPFWMVPWFSSLNTTRWLLLWGKLKIENCTVLIPEGKSYCRLKRSAKGPWFKVSSKRLSPDIDILIQSHIPKLTELDVAFIDS